MRQIRVIDSHTGGEPTRTVISGGPNLGDGTLAERRERFTREFDKFRSAVVNEPRGSEVFVGALLVEPQDKSCVAGVIFFNNVGVLNMCGHGTIGLVVTLAHLGRIKPGAHKIVSHLGRFTQDEVAIGREALGAVVQHRVSAHRGRGVQAEQCSRRREHHRKWWSRSGGVDEP